MSSSSMMTMSRTYKGIVFDFNGTLIWDTPFHERAWIAFSERMGHPIDSRTYYRDVHGKTTVDILTMLVGHEVDEQQIGELSRKKEELYRGICVSDPEHFVLAPGAEAMLERLHRREVPMTIATASEIENVEFFIDSFGLERWFDRSKIVYDDGLIPNKPSPDIYLKASENLGFTPADLAVVEDSYFGLLAARRAGFAHIFLAGTPREDQDRLLASRMADTRLDSFDEIDSELFT